MDHRLLNTQRGHCCWTWRCYVDNIGGRIHKRSEREARARQLSLASTPKRLSGSFDNWRGITGEGNYPSVRQRLPTSEKCILDSYNSSDQSQMSNVKLISRLPKCGVKFSATLCKDESELSNSVHSGN
jgi:hypothetical protein